MSDPLDEHSPGHQATSGSAGQAEPPASRSGPLLTVAAVVAIFVIAIAAALIWTGPSAPANTRGPAETLQAFADDLTHGHCSEAADLVVESDREAVLGHCQASSPGTHTIELKHVSEDIRGVNRATVTCVPIEDGEFEDEPQAYDFQKVDGEWKLEWR